MKDLEQLVKTLDLSKTQLTRQALSHYLQEERHSTKKLN